MIKKQGGSYVLKSKSTGKTLGRHGSRVGALKQERAIKASQHRASRKS